MLKSSLCDYSDAYIFISVTITINGAGADDVVKRLNERNKGVIFKNYAPLTDCINKIYNAQIDNAKGLMLWYRCIIYQYLLKNISKFVAVLQRWSKR